MTNEWNLPVCSGPEINSMYSRQGRGKMFVTRELAGRLAFPVLAVVVAGTLLFEQMNGGYRSDTSAYTYGLAVPVILFGCIQILIDVIGYYREAGTREDSDVPPLQWRRPLALLASVIVFIAVLEPLGYILSLAAFLVFAFWLLDIRRVIPVLTITTGTIAFIHIVFVLWLETPLPKGLLEGVF